jgi:hypothetical protein
MLPLALLAPGNDLFSQSGRLFGFGDGRDDGFVLQ